MGSSVFEGGLNKKQGWNVQKVKVGLLLGAIGAAAAVGIYNLGFEDQVLGLTDGTIAKSTMLGSNCDMPSA